MPATSVRCSVPTSTDSFSSFFDFAHLLGGQHLRDAQLHLHEVVDRDALVSPARGGRSGRGGGRCGAGGGRRAGGRAPRCGARPAVHGLSAHGRSVSLRGHSGPSWSQHAFAVVAPAAVAVEVEIVARRADAAQDLAARRRHDRRSSTAARRIASAASNSTCDSRSAGAGSLASVHGAVAAMNSLAPSISRNAAAAPSCSAKRSIAAR